MKAIVYADNTLPLPIEPLCNLLNKVCKKVSFVMGQEILRINSPSIISRSSFKKLPKGLIEEAKGFDFAFLCTNVPYEDGLFFDYYQKMAIISFNEWNLYTDLPVTNGLVYFIASCLCDELDISTEHEDNTGCVNDFFWDKTGVNLGMRAAFICGRCQSQYKGDRLIFEDIQNLLDLVSSASRLGRDVLKPRPADEQGKTFDVFLCHNNKDKPAIKKINKAFRKAGINTWFDEEQCEFGRPWQPAIEKAIDSIRNACVFFGDNGIGPNQEDEVYALLRDFKQRGCPVIPVMLPGAKKPEDMPLFLKQMTWVDLRRDRQTNLKRLIAAIKRRSS